MTRQRLDGYLNFKELEAELHQLAKAHPGLATLHSIGKSHQGRDLWLMELTSADTGEGLSKPGFYIDANTHAEEVLGSVVALETIRYLLQEYGREESVTRLLDQRVFYILPRVNPDGAEFCLEEGMLWVGNGRFLPGEEQPEDGFYHHDVNDDGIVAQMRIEDPQGEWKPSEEDPRLLVQRRPDEVGGTYYRLLPEGRVRNFDGANILLPRPKDGNLNRNYPSNWLPDHRQYGAGELPLSEPEIAAICRFILDHPNIAGAQFYHTHGGVILRPFLDKPDTAFPGIDKRVFEAIGKMGEEFTGYKLISVYEEFTSDKDAPRSGTSMEWCYETLGMVCYSTELWDVQNEAGIGREEFQPGEERSEERELKLLQWVDAQENLRGYLEWEPFDHPELGPVEIGGWNRNEVFRNAPKSKLAEVAEGNMKFTFSHAAACPLLEIESLELERIEGSVYKVAAIIANTGYLPTHLTDMAIREGQAPGVEVTLGGEGIQPVMGDLTTNIGNLAGRSERFAGWSPFGNEWGTPRKRVEWVLRVAPETQMLTVQAKTPRAGVATQEIRINE